MKKQKFSIAIVTIIGFIIVGCTSTSSPSPTSTPRPSPTPTPPRLSQTYAFPNFGFTIDYPEGWFVNSTRAFSIICELEEDKNSLSESNVPVSGYCINHEHRSMNFMRSIGLPADPTLEDLLQFNRDFLNFQNPKTSETTLFDAPALQVMTIGDSGPTITLMGFVNDEAFLLTLIAPTEEALEAFKPVWDEILASIKPV